MREQLDDLCADGFKAHIVLGGGVEFLRVVSEKMYGVPPEKVIGLRIETRFEPRNGRPAIVHLPRIDFVDDKAGEPVGIHRLTGKRPIAAFAVGRYRQFARQGSSRRSSETAQ